MPWLGCAWQDALPSRMQGSGSWRAIFAKASRNASTNELIVIKVHALHIITHPQDAVRLRRGVGEVAGQLRARDVHRGVERKPAHVGVAGLLLQACRTEDGRASVARLLARAADGWEPAGLCGATSLIQAHAVMTAQATQLCAARSSDARIEQATEHAMQQCGAPALGCCA